LITSALTGKRVNVSGRDVRIEPDSGSIEPESGRTQYGLALNDWGDRFGSSNNNPIFQFVISDRYVRRNRFFPAPDSKLDLILPAPAPPVFPASRTVDRFNDLYDANRFTSACSPIFFRDTTLGEDMASSALVCEPVHNLVHRTLIKQEGITFRGQRHPDEKASEFFASTDVWARPVKIATGPDGALWVADMYRFVIEHPQWIPEEWQRRVNLRAGEDKGRIYRIYRTGHRPGALPRLADKSPAELVDLLESTNGTVRDMAQQLLVQAGGSAAVAALDRLAATSGSPVARIHALSTLSGLNALSADHVEAALGDADWRVQRFALVLAEPMLDRDQRFGGLLTQLVEHPEIALRYQLALTLGEWRTPQAGATLGRLALRDMHDRWMRTAVLSSASDHSEQILAAVLVGRSSDVSTDWAQLVEHLISTAMGHQPDGAAARVLAAITAEQPGGIQAWQIGALSAFLEAAARRNVDLDADAFKTDEKFAASWTSARQIYDRARILAGDPEAMLADRQAAVRLLARNLGDSSADKRLLAGLLSPKSPPSLQAAALATLAGLRSEDVAGLMLEDWRSHSPDLRERILNVLLSRRDWTAALLDALETNRVAPVDLDASARSRLISYRAQDISARAQKLLASLVSADREQVLAAYEAAVHKKGNLLRGASAFDRRCATCHRFRGRGNEIGPNLAGLRDKSSRNLLISILDPNRAVERAYLEYAVATLDGRMYNGMIVNESSSSLSIAQPNGQTHVVLRADVENLSGTGKSFMPEGLERDIDVAELADLFAFLQSAPQPVGRTAAAAAEALLDQAGWIGLASVVSNGGHKTRSTWLGEIDIPHAGAGSAQPLIWRSAPVPPETDRRGTAVFRLPAIVGKVAAGREKDHSADASTNNAGGAFQIAVNGDKVLEFPAPAGDASYSSPDGRAVVRYLAMEEGADATSGVLEIELAGSLWKPGKDVEFSVRPVRDAGGCWFGLIPVN
jgi:putative heme-binding domain-containing protein